MPLPVRLSCGVLGVLALAAVFGPLLPVRNPYAQDLMAALRPPGAPHWLGTDQLGRDLLARIVIGSRFSLLIGLGAVAVGLTGGVPFGMVAGFYGGWVDALFTRVIDVLLAFPGIILALAVVAVTGPGIGNLTFAVGLRTLPVLARVARGQTLALRNREFVDAARALGCRPWEILARHILPNIGGSLVVVASLQTATAVLIGATLTFLGVGASPEIPEWGAMLNAARPYMLRYPHLILVPALTLMVVMMAFNVAGDYLRDRLDPYASTAS
ncbi:MAG: ABC transporter permease [Armatimonadetes bacterium]|nr:ABC transporter permease [Armatimonadota bacterium]